MFAISSFANNLQLNTNDRYEKALPLFTCLNEKWLLHIPRNNFDSVDEAMVEYHGKHGLKQHIIGKLNWFGYKV